ncbi:hypothetical protein Cantr_02200 [Candida viswanathii]|uniref:Uncharacterized protein n=1 Tax=Candida viswanathii TaxID=5486 RepID=A0A367YKW7_9ASCO|nr:hypothetical protein Cantr_02200 [Candida viswanathii]
MSEDLFKKLAELPVDVITIIIDHLPKCMLPHLLYYLPIRSIVAACILSDVKITLSMLRHSKGYYLPGICEECVSNPFAIELPQLRKGIEQWEIHPKSVHLCSLGGLKRVRDTYPELLDKAQFVSGIFDYHEDADRKILVKSKVKFERLKLVDYGDFFVVQPGLLPSSIKQLELVSTSLSSYKIKDLERLIIQEDKPLNEAAIATLPPGLKELDCQIHVHGEFRLPNGLRTLAIDAFNNPSVLKLGQMDELRNLKYTSRHIKKVDEMGLIANNLKILMLSSCCNLFDYQRLRRFNNLEMFAIFDGFYPVKLFNETSFPKMKSFLYTGRMSTFPIPEARDKKQELAYLEEISDLALILPPNLHMVDLTDVGDMTINLGKSKFPESLRVLNMAELKFSNDSMQLPKMLENLNVDCPTFEFESDFEMPANICSFSIGAKRIGIVNPHFLYNLPPKLEHLSLKASKQATIANLPEKITWPDSMRHLELRRFGIDRELLEKLNLKSSKIDNIEFYKGKLGKLDLDLFPVGIDRLFLERMGITELPKSLKVLPNLRHLSLRRNYLGNVRSIEMPQLHCLNLSHCDLRFLSPFVKSMVNDAKKSKLEDDSVSEFLFTAMENWHLSPKDVKKLLKMVKSMNLTVNSFDSGLQKFAVTNNRLMCSRNPDIIFDLETEYSELEDNVEEEEDDFLSHEGSLGCHGCGFHPFGGATDSEPEPEADPEEDEGDDDDDGVTDYRDMWEGDYPVDYDDEWGDNSGDEGAFGFGHPMDGSRLMSRHIFMDDEDLDGDADFGDFQLPAEADNMSVLTALIGMQAVREGFLPPSRMQVALESGYLGELVRLAFGDRYGEGRDGDDDEENDDEVD